LHRIALIYKGNESKAHATTRHSFAKCKILAFPPHKKSIFILSVVLFGRDRCWGAKIPAYFDLQNMIANS
jgi:hypothetical protein